MNEENKSKKIGIIIVVILIILLLIGGGIAWYVVTNMDKNKPEDLFILIQTTLHFT